MKILKIFGIVVGIHVFALILIFANPGCSSTSQPPPAPTDTVVRSDAPPPVSLPMTAPASSSRSEPTGGAPVISFNPDAPAIASASSATGSRYVPTRPGTPVVGTLVAEPVADVVPAATYVVKSGESLWTIAKKNNLTVAELGAANNLTANAKIQPGQKLLIPGSKSGLSAGAATAKGAAGSAPKATEGAPATASTRPGPDGIKHVVKSGETLGTIARLYGVKQGDIAVANNISDPAKIKANTELIIPGWQAPASKSGKSKAGAGASKSNELPVEQTQPTAPPAVPVIPVYDSPITPAPKL